MLENVALQVAEVGNRSQQLAMFLAGLEWDWGELDLAREIQDGVRYKQAQSWSNIDNDIAI